MPPGHSLAPSTALPATPADAAAQLAQAARSLWLATLSLMTAFMNTQAPAHRYLLARRIARNFETLSRQTDCFGADCCRRFGRLAARWDRQAMAHSPDAESAGAGARILQALRRFAMSVR